MTLVDDQHSIADWIRAPEGVARALFDEDAQANHGNSGQAKERLERLIRSDHKLDAAGRLDIYANAYFHRILGVLKADYPALLQALGTNAFNDLVTSYLLVEPSRHPSLRYAGLRLADFIASHDAANDLRARSPFAADLAAFEWARVDSFDAVDGPALSREMLTTIAPEKFGSIYLCLGPSVLIRTFEYQVSRLWRAAIDGEMLDEANMSAVSTSMLIWRKDEAVLHRSLRPQEEAALALQSLGTRFEDLCEWAAVEIGEEQAPAQAAAWLGQWLADGLLAAPEEMGAD